MRASSNRLVHLANGTAAFMVLAALLVSVPLALALIVGWPLPHHLPPLAGLRTSGTTLGISDEALVDVLACVAWLAWFNILISTIGNIASGSRLGVTAFPDHRYISPAYCASVQCGALGITCIRTIPAHRVIFGPDADSATEGVDDFGTDRRFDRDPDGPGTGYITGQCAKRSTDAVHLHG
jgi:hypothetical protein